MCFSDILGKSTLCEVYHKEHASHLSAFLDISESLTKAFFHTPLHFLCLLLIPRYTRYTKTEPDTWTIFCKNNGNIVKVTVDCLVDRQITLTML